MNHYYNGLTIKVEHPRGSVRRGVDANGKPWKRQMLHDYGFIRSTRGHDNEQIDAYVGPHDDASHAYIIHQHNPNTNLYDEDKVMLGFRNEHAAKLAYLLHYDKPQYLGGCTPMPIQNFKTLVNETGYHEKLRWKDRVHLNDVAQFDAGFEKEHPRKWDGRFTEKSGKVYSPKNGPVIHVKEDDAVEKYDDWNKRWSVHIPDHEKSGWKQLMDHRIIPRDKVPVLYHVTGRMNDIKKSGYLRATSSFNSGGLGGQHSSSISFTPDKETADRLLKEMTRLHRIAHAPTFQKAVQLLRRIAEKDGAPKSLETILSNVNTDIQWTKGIRRKVSDQKAIDILFDGYKNYLILRDFETGIPNPVIYGKRDSFLKTDPAGIGIVEVHPEHIPQEALVTSGGDRQHNEIKVHSDIPVQSVPMTAKTRLDFSEDTTNFASADEFLQKMLTHYKGQLHNAESFVKDMKDKLLRNTLDTPTIEKLGGTDEAKHTLDNVLTGIDRARRTELANAHKTTEAHKAFGKKIALAALNAPPEEPEPEPAPRRVRVRELAQETGPEMLAQTDAQRKLKILAKLHKKGIVRDKDIDKLLAMGEKRHRRLHDDLDEERLAALREEAKDAGPRFKLRARKIPKLTSVKQAQLSPAAKKIKELHTYRFIRKMGESVHDAALRQEAERAAHGGGGFIEEQHPRAPEGRTGKYAGGRFVPRSLSPEEMEVRKDLLTPKIPGKKADLTQRQLEKNEQIAAKNLKRVAPILKTAKTHLQKALKLPDSKALNTGLAWKLALAKRRVAEKNAGEQTYKYEAPVAKGEYYNPRLDETFVALDMDNPPEHFKEMIAAGECPEFYRPMFGGIYVPKDPNSRYTMHAYARGGVNAGNFLTFQRESIKERNQVNKWETVDKIDDKMDDILSHTLEDAKTKDTALAMLLVEKSGVRAQSEKSDLIFGASSLQRRHVRREGKNLVLDFIGKSTQVRAGILAQNIRTITKDPKYDLTTVQEDFRKATTQTKKRLVWDRMVKICRDGIVYSPELYDGIESRMKGKEANDPLFSTEYNRLLEYAKHIAVSNGIPIVKGVDKIKDGDRNPAPHLYRNRLGMVAGDMLMDMYEKMVGRPTTPEAYMRMIAGTVAVNKETKAKTPAGKATERQRARQALLDKYGSPEDKGFAGVMAIAGTFFNDDPKAYHGSYFRDDSLAAAKKASKIKCEGTWPTKTELAAMKLPQQQQKQLSRKAKLKQLHDLTPTALKHLIPKS